MGSNSECKIMIGARIRTRSGPNHATADRECLIGPFHFPDGRKGRSTQSQVAVPLVMVLEKENAHWSMHAIPVGIEKADRDLDWRASLVLI